MSSERTIKLRHVVPSIVTVFALCAGLTSVRMSLEGHLETALAFILIAVFLDAAHDYDSIKADITAWRPKCRHTLCGHDYNNGHDGVRRAVDELFGQPDGTVDAIWWVLV